MTTSTKVTCYDIADYFIYLAHETGSFISNLKLQKLVYYAQVWYLAIYGTPLFDEDFEAWVHGPVIPTLYKDYKQFFWKHIDKNVEKPDFTQELQDFLDELTDIYFTCDTYDLERMTRQEYPWLKARGGIPMDAISSAVISKQSMQEYYKARAEEKE